jgi:predicted O-methyltransferase YrrM
MPLLDAVQTFKEKTRRFFAPERNGSYSYANNYFTSPDAEVAYALVRQIKPKRVIEVGSGNSTQLFREAIDDGELSTELVSIDPSPRIDIGAIAHRVFSERLEQLPISYICDALDSSDILFIDSSHQIRIGNDVVHLLLNIIPALKKGVLIHFHDIFLPYEYPRQWIIDNVWDWNEQYIVQALLQGSGEWDVLWPGHFLQRTLPEFSAYFEFKPQGMASSLWLRKVA